MTGLSLTLSRLLLREPIATFASTVETSLAEAFEPQITVLLKGETLKLGSQVFGKGIVRWRQRQILLAQPRGLDQVICLRERCCRLGENMLWRALPASQDVSRILEAK